MKTLIFAFASLLLTAVAIPLTIAAIAPNLSPYAAEFPGERTFDNPGGPIPATVAAFEPFKNRLGLSWDDDFLYIESNGLPDHDMMRGITAWQQQVPLPHAYVGDNRFALPLNPTVLEEPQALTLLGPIAIAVNGIPIFHALIQSGKDAYLGGELDEWGGHCGRADDYHYHIAPSHLEEIASKGNPIAFGLDGHPVYLEDPANDKPLDECHGYFDDEGIYRYIGNLENPYMMAYFRGAADLEDRPRAQGVRPFLQPLRGAEITEFSGTLAEGYSLEYKVRGETHQINYEVTDTGADFEFFDPAGNAMKESYQRQANNGGKGSDRPPGGKKGKGGTRRYIEPLARGKGTLYEGGIRVPTAIWGPGVKQGKTSEPMLSMDIYPTLLDLAGLKPHADHPLDGESLAPLLSGASTRLDRDRVFWHFPSYIGGGGPSSAMRMGDWKVIEQFETQSFEIYDLSTDPGETRNLAEAAPGQAKTLLEALHNWQSSTGAPRTTVPNPNFDPSAEPKRGRDQRGNKNDKPPIRRTPQSF